MNRKNSNATRSHPTLPTSKKWLVDGFLYFSSRMVAKQFQSFAIQVNSAELDRIPPTTPVVVLANHASWWDPISASLIRQKYLSNRIFYAPIDADALKNYRIMADLGFYGLKLNTIRGAADFLATTQAILETPNSALFITPEGKFTDVRDHSPDLMPGLSHLISKVPEVVFVPLALEYGFWDESRPQIIAKLRNAIHCVHRKHAETELSKSQWNELLTQRLRQTQTELANSVIQREESAFQYVIASRPKRLGWYDYFRSWRAFLRGHKFDPRHSAPN
jgi:hypothetical protein